MMNARGQIDTGSRSSSGQCGQSEINVGDAERVASVVLGLGLAVHGLRNLNSAGGLVALVSGGGLIYRGVAGSCALYQALGISTSCAAKSQTSAIGKRKDHGQDFVDESSEESFPASDAPSWTSSTASSHPR